MLDVPGFGNGIGDVPVLNEIQVIHGDMWRDQIAIQLKLPFGHATYRATGTVFKNDMKPFWIFDGFQLLQGIQCYPVHVFLNSENIVF